MSTQQSPGWLPDHSVLLAQVSCLCFGLGLTAWGLAPAVLERLITGKTPSLDMLIVNSFLFAVGGTFVMTHVLIRRRVRWAGWLAFVLSVMLAGGSVAVMLATGMQIGSTFLLLMSTVTAFAAWLAIGALDELEQDEPFEFGSSDEEIAFDAPNTPRKPRSNLLTHL